MSPRRVFLAILIAFVAVQLVPYGRSHSNPPVGTLPAWDSPRTEALARRACFDCHSHETRWPWYASIAPLSWRIQRHVDEGREKLNFSDFRAGNEEAGESAETVREGSMPPADYRLAHPEARLSPGERAELVAGLASTFGEGDGHGDRDD